jgi:hypothetical protein
VARHVGSRGPPPCNQARARLHAAAGSRSHGARRAYRSDADDSDGVDLATTEAEKWLTEGLGADAGRKKGGCSCLSWRPRRAGAAAGRLCRATSSKPPAPTRARTESPTATRRRTGDEGEDEVADANPLGRPRQAVAVEDSGESKGAEVVERQWRVQAVASSSQTTTRKATGLTVPRACHDGGDVGWAQLRSGDVGARRGCWRTLGRRHEQRQADGRVRGRRRARRPGGFRGLVATEGTRGAPR